MLPLVFLLLFSTVNGDSEILSSNITGYLLKDQGESLTISCTMGDNDQCAYKWYKNKKYFKDGSELTLLSIQPSDEGLYECEGCNAANKSYYLDIKVFAPREADNENHITACNQTGNNITLSRIIFAKPLPTIVDESLLLPEDVNETDVLLSLKTTGKYQYQIQWKFILTSSRFYGQFCLNISNIIGTLFTCNIFIEDSCTTIGICECPGMNSTAVDDTFSFFITLNVAIGVGMAVIFGLLFIIVLKVYLKKNAKRGGYNLEQEESMEGLPLRQVQSSLNKVFVDGNLVKNEKRN